MQPQYEFVFEFLGIVFCQQDELEYKEYSYNEPTANLPLKVFEAPPPYGKRIVTLQIELEGTDKNRIFPAACTNTGTASSRRR